MSDTDLELKAVVEIVIDGIGRTADVSVGQIILDSKGRGLHLAELFCSDVPECRSWAVIPSYIWDLSRNTDALGRDLENLRRILKQTIEELISQKAVGQ